MRLRKYHAHGNDYLVCEDPTDAVDTSPNALAAICDRHRGVGADGILLGTPESDENAWRVRIFNADGTEAEKSGNGLRIFARYLWDRGMATRERIQLLTTGGSVWCEAMDKGHTVRADLGTFQFVEQQRSAGPESGIPRLFPLDVGDKTVHVTPIDLGNPHCVLLTDEISESLVREMGPIVESHPRFPQRTNVQFAKIMDRRTLQIAIWERGSGYTLSSGTGSCAAAAVAVRLGRMASPVSVHMPGGAVSVEVTDDDHVVLSGPVTYVCRIDLPRPSASAGSTV